MHASGRMRTTRYVYEPGSFTPLMLASREGVINLHAQSVHDRRYDVDRDPLWVTVPRTGSLRVVSLPRKANPLLSVYRGSQYCSGPFQDALKTYGMRLSMSRCGNCLDSAPTKKPVEFAESRTTARSALRGALR